MGINRNSNTTFKVELNIYLGSYTSKEEAQVIHDKYKKVVKDFKNKIIEEDKFIKVRIKDGKR